MGDPIISADIVDLGTITSRSEVAAYPDDNVKNYWSLQRRFRADDLTKNDWLLKFDFGAAKSIAAVMLNHVNFDKVKIQGHTSDDWTNPDYPGTTVDISVDNQVDRYKVYIPLTGFNYRWMRIFIPSEASAVGSYQTKWEVSSVAPLDSYKTVKKNAYVRTAGKQYTDISLPHGGFERVTLGDDLRWSGRITIDLRAETDEGDYWEFNQEDISKPHVFYENRGDTEKVYLCLRDDAYEGNLVHHGAVIGNTISFLELV